MKGIPQLKVKEDGTITNLGAVLTAFAEASEGIASSLKEQDREIKAFGEVSTKTAEDFKKKEALWDQAVADIAGFKEFNEQFKAFEAKFHEFEAKGQRPGATGVNEKSLGAIYTESEQYKSMLASGRFESGAVELPNSFDHYVMKALSLAPGSAPPVVPFRFPEIISAPTRKLRIRDLLTVATTTQSSIDYVQETGFTTEASPNTQKQGAAAMVAEGATKPEARMTFTLLSATVRTLAHWIAVTRQAVEDIPQLMAYIDGRLTYGLYYAEEQQLLYGNGTSPNIQGILTHPNIQTYLWSNGPVGLGANRDTKIDAIRRSFTKSQLAQYPVTGVILHPSDWEDIELAKASDGHYLWTTTLNPLYNREEVWKVPVVPTDAINQGTWLSGAFSLGAYLWDRQQANIRVSEHHASMFVQNMIAILAEERIALTIFRPESFVKGTFDAPPAATAP